MANDPRITGFPANDVRNGLRTAFRVGMPPLEAEQPTFFMPRTVTNTEPADANNVPFDPAVQPTRGAPTSHKVPCAIEYIYGDGKVESYGVVISKPSKVVLTLLDEDYATVKGFSYVVISGLRYWFKRTENTKGLVSVGLHKVHCVSEDED